MMPKSHTKIKNPFQLPIFNYFLTVKKYHANKYTFLRLNRIMRTSSNVYNYAISLLRTLSIQ